MWLLLMRFADDARDVREATRASKPRLTDRVSGERRGATRVHCTPGLDRGLCEDGREAARTREPAGVLPLVSPGRDSV